MKCNTDGSHTLSFPTKFPSWHRPKRLCTTAMESHLQRCWDSPNGPGGTDVSTTASGRLQFNVRLLLLFGLLPEVSMDSLVNKDSHRQMFSHSTAENSLLREDRF